MKHQSFFFKHDQHDVACPFGAENIMHDLSTDMCIDKYRLGDVCFSRQL